MTCKIELCTTPVVKTTWWKPSEDYGKAPINIWWLEAEGTLPNGRTWRESREATDIEVELWQRIQAQAELIARLEKQFPDTVKANVATVDTQSAFRQHKFEGAEQYPCWVCGMPHKADVHQ